MTAWTGKECDREHLKPFGAVGYVYDEVNGLHPKGTKAYLIGYSPRHADGTYDMFDPSSRSMRPASANVTFVTPRFATGDATNAPDNVLLAELNADAQPSRVDLVLASDEAPTHTPTAAATTTPGAAAATSATPVTTPTPSPTI